MFKSNRGLYCCLYNFAQGLTIAASGSNLLHCQIHWPVGRAGLFHLRILQGSQQRSTLMKGGNPANKSQRFLNRYCPLFFLLAFFFFWGPDCLVTNILFIFFCLSLQSSPSLLLVQNRDVPIGLAFSYLPVSLGLSPNSLPICYNHRGGRHFHWVIHLSSMPFLGDKTFPLLQGFINKERKNI